MIRINKQLLLLVGFIILATSLTPIVVSAASNRFIGVQKVLRRMPETEPVLSFSISLASYSRVMKQSEIPQLQKIKSSLVYFSKAEVKGKIYFRLIMGNFSHSRDAINKLARVKKHFPDAWIYKRGQQEQTQLKKRLISVNKEPEPVVIAKVTKPKRINKQDQKKIDFAAKLLAQSRQLLLDGNYYRLVQVSEKIIETGSAVQQQKAMEYEGIARERQRKFSQAVAIYKRFLKLYPESEMAPRIKVRLQGLTTMNLNPKAKLVKRLRRKADESWNFNGSISQYYRDNVIDTTADGTDRINSSLLTDISFVARRKKDNTTWSYRFDGGIVNDFLDNTNSGDISRAMVRYSNGNRGYEIIGGRQTRTAKGVLGRFDGVVLNLTRNQDIVYTLYGGFPVASSSDGFDNSRNFLGGSVNIKPLEKMEMDIYLMQQNIDGLTDRQALGTEIQYRTDKGFLYGIFDYDTFYNELNDITAIANYRYSNELVFNLTYDYRNSPWLTTLNAIQSQSVATIKELQTLFTDEEIYQFAQDRTSKSHSLFFGTYYQIDKSHQIDASITLSSLDATVASGGVEVVDASQDLNILASYTINGFFQENDFTSFGTSLSDTSASKNISLRFRTRFKGRFGIRYDPRLQLDYRESKTSEVSQWILKPSIKLKYKLNRETSFEGSVGIDYSNFNLPELDDQKSYNLFLGYSYYF
jgi:hypothetical protein